MNVNGFDTNPFTDKTTLAKYVHMICLCSGKPYVYDTIDTVKRKCRKCNKPPDWLLRKCIECGYVWTHIGLKYFVHPNYCPTHPTCYDCCNDVDPWHYCFTMTTLSEHGLRPQEAIPPKQRKVVLSPGESVFDF